MHPAPPVDLDRLLRRPERDLRVPESRLPCGIGDDEEGVIRVFGHERIQDRECLIALLLSEEKLGEVEPRFCPRVHAVPGCVPDHGKPSFGVPAETDNAQYPAERLRHFCHQIVEQSESHLGIVKVRFQANSLFE